MSRLLIIPFTLKLHRHHGLPLLSLAAFLAVSSMSATTHRVPIRLDQQDQMSSVWNEPEGSLHIFRRGQLVVVYQRDTKPGLRSIANAITELYAPGLPQINLVADSSPIVPPQLLVNVGAGDCLNDPTSRTCDYFAHHKPQVTISQQAGSAVIFSVTAQASQHNDQGRPIDFISRATITVPFHSEHTIVDYNVRTTLESPADVAFALRPLPFYELVSQRYDSLSYLDPDCKVGTVEVPTNGPPFFIYLDSRVCSISPWAALYDNKEGNLGIILKSWNWSSGQPRLLSFTEIENHPGQPNLYFQSTDAPRLYQSAVWDSNVVFIAYASGPDYLPVQAHRDCGSDSSPETSVKIKVKAKPRNSRNEVLSATSVEVREGDTLCFSASGQWNVGPGPVSPDGDAGRCECPVSDAGGNALLGALVGRIGVDGKPFLIGSTNSIKATRGGTLYLGSNDNLGACTGQRGSCYDDNGGKVKVRIRIKQNN